MPKIKLRKKTFVHLNLILALLLPLIAFAVQWHFWSIIQPFVWFLFYPTVFFSSWLGGRLAGIIATFMSATIAWFFFINPVYSFQLQNPMGVVSIVVFSAMGILFSVFNGQLRKANQVAADALLAAQANNEEITRLYEKTRELDRLKTQFFSTVSHELRTPLTLIIGPVAKCLEDVNLPESIRHDLDVVDRNARLLHHHVTDLLDIAKLEDGCVKLNYVNADLAQVARFMVANFEALVAQKSATFQITIPETLPAQIDIDKVRRILLNLLSNAFKFTPDGGKVTLTITSTDGWALIQLQDDGPGIPAEAHELIFDSYQQIDGDAARSANGTGLGLAIVRQLAELHGGKAQVADGPGGGALFSVTLPLMAPNHEGVIAAAELSAELTNPVEIEGLAPSKPSTNLKLPQGAVESATANTASVISTIVTAASRPADVPLVLVVEDNPDMNAYVTDILTQRYRVLTTFDGNEGLEKALTWHPDLIVSDIMMPVMTGDRMVEILRSHAELADTPIILLTAKADDMERVKLLNNGVQDYLTKPFIANELLARVDGVLGSYSRARNLLRESRDLYRSLFDNMLNGFAYCKMLINEEHHDDFIFLSVNTAFEELTQLKDVLGKPVSQVIPGLQESNPELFKILNRVITQRNGEKFESYLSPLGMWLSISVYCPQPEHFVLVFDVITERKQAEAALIASQHKFASIVEAAMDAIITIDDEQHIVLFNNAAEKLFGCQASDALGSHIERFMPQRFRHNHGQHIRDFEQTGVTRRCMGELGNVTGLRASGEEFPMEASISQLDVAGQKLYSVIMRDVTERLRAEAVLQKQAHLQDQFAKVAASVPGLIYSFRLSSDGSASIPYASPTILDNYGLLAEQVADDATPFFALVHPDDIEKLQNSIAESARHLIAWHDTFRYRHPSKGEIWVEGNSIPKLEADGSVLWHGYVQDITERQQLELERQKFVSLADNSNDFIGICDMNSYPLYINQAGREMVGLDSLEHRIQTSTQEFFFPEDQAFIRDEFFPKVLRDEHANVEIRFRHFKTGAALWVFFNVFIIKDSAGKHVGLATVTNNITARKETQLLLKESEAQFRTMFELASVGMTETDPATGRFRRVNQRYCAMTGYSAEELIGKPFSDITHEGDRETDWKLFADAMRGKTVNYHNEKRYRRKDGKVIWVNINAATIKDGLGQSDRCLAIIEDISPRKKAEKLAKKALQELTEAYKRLHESERDNQYLANFLKKSDQPFATGFMDGRIIYVNDAFERLTGYHRAELLATNWETELTPTEWRAQEQAKLDELHHGSDLVRYEKEYIRKDGTRVPVELLVHLMPECVGQPLHYYAFINDLTERKKAEAKLREADQRKDEFLAMLAHELRNPLAPISSAVQIIAMLDLDDSKLLWARETIERQVIHLTRMVDDLLDVSRIARGKITLKKERLDLIKLIQEVINYVQPSVLSRRHHLDLNLSDRPIFVDGDPVRLTQIALNLLDNAIKYTPNEGLIELTVQRVGNDAQIVVRDNGKGIQAELLPKIFELFQQDERTIDRSQGGLGIGLTLVKGLVEKHGGLITASSAGIDQGSTFCIRLPTSEHALPLATTKRSVPYSLPEGLRVLVVDDDADVRESAAMLLEMHGLKVEIADSGEQAIASINEFHPVVVLLDISLNGENGYQVAKRIRELPCGSDLFLVAVSGYGRSEDIARSKDAGFDHHLVKPLHFNTLSELLSKRKEHLAGMQKLWN